MGQNKFAVVVIDYFTKLVEAEAKPLTTITEQKIQGFIWKPIICRFGIPVVIISDNDKKFDNDKFKGFCFELGIYNIILQEVIHRQMGKQR